MVLNQEASNLVDTTVNAFNGNATSISPLDGISLIDRWVTTLRTSDQTVESVGSGLSELKAELQSGNPDGTQIQRILSDLMDHVKQATDSAEEDVRVKLDSLTEALRGFSQQLSGSADMTSAPYQQAPMTSTVGGESTNSGTGTSAFYANQDDDLSNRNGGTTDSPESPAGSNEQTGSDGAQQQDGGSYGSGYGTGSNGDDYSANSGTQHSGVSGGSTSSGSSDTDTGTSGGRSQY